MRINLYSQNRHIVVVDGIPISSFANGDYLEVHDQGNAATRTQGGDGPALNISVYQGGQVTIGLLPTSPALGVLYTMRDAQKTNPRMFSIQLVTGVEEVISVSGAAFGELDRFTTGGAEMSPRKFLFECLSIKLDGSAVEAIAGGYVGGLV